MLYNSRLLVLATVCATAAFLPASADSPNDEARMKLDVNVPGAFKAFNEIGITRLTSLAPPTIGGGYEKGFMLPASTSGRFKVATPDNNSCLALKDDGSIGKGACSGDDDKVNFAVLCSAVYASPPLCGIFVGQPSDKKCIIYDGKDFKQETGCDAADMQAVQVWRIESH